MRGTMLPDDTKGSCIQLLHLYDSSGAEWQLGKTKVSVPPPPIFLSVSSETDPLLTITAFVPVKP